MADKKISQLTSATTPLAGTEVLPIVQSGSTVKVAVSDLTAGRAVSAGQLNVDNLRLDANTISSTNTDGAVTIAPNGIGAINLTTSDKVLISNSTTTADTIVSAAGTQTNIVAAADRGPAVSLWNTQNTDGTFSTLDFLKSNGLSVSKIAVQTASQAGRTGYISMMTADGAAPAERLTINNTGDVNVKTGNLVVGTAGKGIDFSANTHAAGMTSELLNWYEEGTFTPTFSAETGAITSYTREATYVRIGTMVQIRVAVKITNPGTASGQLNFSGLPFTAYNYTDNFRASTFLVREDENTGVAYQGFILDNGTSGVIAAMNNGAISWTTNNSYVFTTTYRCA